MQNRQRDEMFRDILTVSNGGAMISQVMFKAYLSHSQAKSYLAELIQNGFMEFDSLERVYRTSAKGLEYLKAAEAISDLLTLTVRRSTAGKAAIQSFPFS